MPPGYPTPAKAIVDCGLATHLLLAERLSVGIVGEALDSDATRL